MKKIFCLLFICIQTVLCASEKYHLGIIDSQIPGKLTIVTHINQNGDVLGYIVDNDISQNDLNYHLPMDIKKANPWPFIGILNMDLCF